MRNTHHVFPHAICSSYSQITANKIKLFLNLFIFTDALNVSGGSSAHHQEHITVQSVKIKFKKSCIMLAVIWNYITMHIHMNIKSSLAFVNF